MSEKNYITSNVIEYKNIKSISGFYCSVKNEDENNYCIEVDVPGFKKEDIKIECNKGNLKITAEKHSEKEENNKKKYLHRERKFYEKCERSFYLGEVEEDNISAEFKNGTLVITVPKEENHNSKKLIEIK